MRILLFDTTAYYPSSPLFLEALEQFSHERGFDYEFVDESSFVGSGGTLLHRISHRVLGSSPPGHRALNRALIEHARRFRPELVLICKGSNVCPATLACIKDETGAVLVNYATDDPFNPVVNSRDLVESVPLYDLYACTKRSIMADVRRAGCSEVVYVPFGYKPSVHFPERPATSEEAERFHLDMVFIGGGDSDRFHYLRTLVRAIPTLQLHLYGGYWDRDPVLARYHRGFTFGRGFRLAVGGAKIALNLVRRANRDGHVMRTFEIPACGGFMLAERTEEHLEVFAEDLESAYFDSVDELVDKARYYLAYPTERRRIAAAGHCRVTNGGHTYGHRLAQIAKAAELTRTGFTRREPAG
jgi:hypothetical protein